MKVKLRIAKIFPSEEMKFSDGSTHTMFPFCSEDIMKDRYNGAIFYSTTQIPSDSKYATAELRMYNGKLKLTHWEFQ